MKGTHVYEEIPIIADSAVANGEVLHSVQWVTQLVARGLEIPNTVLLHQNLKSSIQNGMT